MKSVKMVFLAYKKKFWEIIKSLDCDHKYRRVNE